MTSEHQSYFAAEKSEADTRHVNVASRLDSEYYFQVGVVYGNHTLIRDVLNQLPPRMDEWAYLLSHDRFILLFVILKGQGKGYSIYMSGTEDGRHIGNAYNLLLPALYGFRALCGIGRVACELSFKII